MVQLPWDWDNTRKNVELAYIIDEWISLPRLTLQGDVQRRQESSKDSQE